ncbi:thymidine kinase [Macacine alphaherpesvirus 1]|uniref:Thymidine kinase n=2 Tax=Cercopithecine herpesvirus 1 TaxID=10325 RepID=Q806A6_CHV1|nr:thymidine kinase [Macacine alphaherpesvirus 1]AAP41492.1 thymidine kinase [Macacine alphaherpesvirus 1]ABO20838.1 thymidine kinase [Macacine alphaherpesvirus 1]ARS01884.1 thymidine kinase [Macacine alphaherpesvirus 1]ARS01959.1 thymidine kinase [Macacine alphaherpesvirus 1]ARS02034.1 thymidine kinase [Macacine alphaherpesvirus 1]
MASHAGHQDAPALDRVAGPAGHDNRPSALLRIYVDGPHGLGKTTTAAALAAALGRRDEIEYVPEPMAYWQTLGGPQTITRIFDAQHRLDRGEISAGEAAVAMASAQVTMSTPYAVTESAVAPHIGAELPPGHGPHPNIDLTLVFDRHPVAPLLCYPAARYLMGSLSLPTVLSFAALLPQTTPGTNLVLGALPEAVHAERLAQRQRPGERLDLAMLSAIRRVYDMLGNAIVYLQQGGSWRADWRRLSPARPAAASGRPARILPRPEIEDTIFALFCAPELLDGTGEPYRVFAWTLDLLAERLRPMHLLVLDYNQAPHHCWMDLMEMIPEMTPTLPATPGSMLTLQLLAREFAREMTSARGGDAGGEGSETQ